MVFLRDGGGMGTMIDLEEFALFDSKSGVEEDASDGVFIKVVLPANAAF